MSSKVPERYVAILEAVLKAVRDIAPEKRDKFHFKRSFFFTYVSDITDKTYKNSMTWFVEREIFDTIGIKFSLEYKLHKNFKYKLSKSNDTLKKQCQFIIGQLYVFSNKIWDESSSVYEDVILRTNLYDFKPFMRKTIAEVVVNNYNMTNQGIYRYELLLILLKTQVSFNIKIKNNRLNINMKSVKLKKIIFNKDTLTLKFNDSQFEIESLEHIKFLEVEQSINLKEKINKAMKELKNDDTVSAQYIRTLFDYHTIAEEIFFQKYNTAKDT